MTLLVLAVGLWLFGTGEAFLVDSGLGVSPWTVLAQGLDTQVPIGIGWATFLVSVVVLGQWVPLRERPGLGTLANTALVALALGVTVPLLPSPDSVALQVVEVLVGISLIGLGSGLYLTTGLGPGPRDGWMTGIHHRTGIPVTPVRLAIEVTVLGLGWLLGGTVGVGTVAFAVLIGPSVGYGLAGIGRLGRATTQVTSDDAPATEA
ncbi:MAG TPA: hypothetical protein VMW94_00630 [Actinomycetes bacterium]|nr:hypothetical protein [Actinomycetes bacterium]